MRSAWLRRMPKAEAMSSVMSAAPMGIDLRPTSMPPMCYPRGDLIIGAQDVYLGDIGGQPFYIGAAQYEYWKHTQIIIDAIPGRGGMFSLEGPEGMRFHSRSRLFDDVEWKALEGQELARGGAT